MYSVGKQLIPMHVLCGEWWEILDMKFNRFCIIVGTREKAQAVVNRLNGV